MKKGTKILISVLVVAGVAAIVSPFVAEYFLDKNADKMAEKRVEETKPLLEKYLKDNYSDLEYTIKDVYYVYKGNQVYMDIDVKDSEDKDFSIYINENNEIFSTYKDVVDDMTSAANRVNQYLLDLSQKGLEKSLFNDNFEYTFINLDWEAWQKDLPEYDMKMEEILKKYPISVEVNLKDMSSYSEREIAEFKEKVKELYLKEDVELDSVTFRDVTSQNVY